MPLTDGALKTKSDLSKPSQILSSLVSSPLCFCFLVLYFFFLSSLVSTCSSSQTLLSSLSVSLSSFLPFLFPLFLLCAVPLFSFFLRYKTQKTKKGTCLEYQCKWGKTLEQKKQQLPTIIAQRIIV